MASLIANKYYVNFFFSNFREITGITYCSQMDYLVTASTDVTIRVWGPDWELKIAFVGHTGESYLGCF